MTGFGLGMATAAALSWSALDAARKRLVRSIAAEVLLVLLTLGQCPTFAVGYWLHGQGVDDWRRYGPLLALGIAVNLGANLLYLRAVRVSPLSVVIPMLAFVPVFTAAVANPLLGELPSPSQWVGIVLVFVGALTLNAADAPSRRLRDLVSALLRERGAIYMTLSAVLWSLGIVLDKLATQHASLPAHGLWLNLGIGLAVLAGMSMRRRLGQLAQVGGHPWLCAGAVAAATLGMSTQLVAIQQVLTGVVEAVKRAVGMVAAVIVGRFAFGEALGSAKVLAVVLMSSGAAVIVLG